MNHTKSMASNKLIYGIYIPYSDLAASPVTLHVGRVPVTLVLTSDKCCTISIPPSFIMADSESSSQHNCAISAQANLGTSFILSYQGSECEVRLGRIITVTDQSTYIQQ